MRYAATIALLATLLLPGPGRLAAQAGGTDGRLTIATVQFRVEPALYTSVDRFRSEVDRLVGLAVDRYGADLVVFPEYVNLFLVASFYPSIIAEASSIEDALRRIRLRETTNGALTPALILRRHAGEVASLARSIWRPLADRHDVSIIPGTFIAPVTTDGETELRNRAIVVDEDGEIVHRHDKAYLTREEERLGISAADVEDASLVEIDGVAVGITICRDTYFGSWRQPYEEADLWIDLRANGEEYDEEVYERFLGTLPERVVESGAAAGVNASLTGSFLGYLWEGPSYAVDAAGHRIAESSAAVGTEITAVELARDEAGWRLKGPLNPRSGSEPRDRRRTTDASPGSG